jgi:triacylglycerol esterase/lipase EstA (alpha/beta hydrolase family)
MARDKMHDLVVLLPGISGSVLQRDNEDLWAISGQALWTAMRDGRERIAKLRLPEHSPDWRRSNRETAAALDRFLGQQLERWRTWSHWKDAKVILLAHSMGGLVARYCLEVLKRWPDCRALITFGTPFRGSLNALDYLANGFRKAGVDMTDVMRSMPSVWRWCMCGRPRGCKRKSENSDG